MLAVGEHGTHSNKTWRLEDGETCNNLQRPVAIGKNLKQPAETSSSLHDTETTYMYLKQPASTWNDIQGPVTTYREL